MGGLYFNNKLPRTLPEGETVSSVSYYVVVPVFFNGRRTVHFLR